MRVKGGGFVIYVRALRAPDAYAVSTQCLKAPETKGLVGSSPINKTLGRALRMRNRGGGGGPR